MKKIVLFFTIITVIVSCNVIDKKNNKEKIVKEFIGFINNGNSVKVDSITSYDFKLLTDSDVTEKPEYLTSLFKRVGNTKIQIEEIKTIDGTVKTKEKITSDLTTILNIEPISRKREYHFNDSNLIKSIYNIEQFASPDYKKIQKYFSKWAYQEYPEFFKAMIEKANKNKNTDEETRYLLTRLKEKGITVLDAFNTESSTNNIKQTEKYLGNDYENPNSDFKSSLVITYMGMNAFPFGEYTVQAFENAIKSTVMSNGKTPIINGWTKSDNVYTLNVNYMGENVQFIFTHLLNQEGKASVMSGKINGEKIDGVQMYQLVPSLVRK
jgi:hypothetical protein